MTGFLRYMPKPLAFRSSKNHLKLRRFGSGGIMEHAQRWVVGGAAIDPLLVFAIISMIAVAGLLALTVIVWRNGRERAREAVQRQSEAHLFEMEVAALKGRLQTM